jgi:hypothetical protein
LAHSLGGFDAVHHRDHHDIGCGLVERLRLEVRTGFSRASRVALCVSTSGYCRAWPAGATDNGRTAAAGCFLRASRRPACPTGQCVRCASLASRLCSRSSRV